MRKKCFEGVTEPSPTFEGKIITLQSMIFCKSYDCLYYFEDKCMTGELENDNRVPYNLENDWYKSETECPYYKEGTNEAYDE